MAGGPGPHNIETEAGWVPLTLSVTVTSRVANSGRVGSLPSSILRPEAGSRRSAIRREMESVIRFQRGV